MSLHRRLVEATKSFKTSNLSRTAGELQYHKHICIEWKIRRDDVRIPDCVSPVFYFLGIEMNFKLCVVQSRLRIYINRDFVLDDRYDFEAYLLDKSGSKRSSFTGKDRGGSSINSSDGTSWYEIWSMDTLDLVASKKSLFSNDCLNFVFVVNMKSTEFECRNGEGKDALKESSLEKLSEDVSKLYNSGEASDITLRCGNRTIPVHKTILSARSDVFAAMFRNPMSESRDGAVDIPDIVPPILDLLVRYIYSGKLGEVVTGDTVLQLYEASDKYGVETLKRECASTLCRELTHDNVCDILFLADLHSDQNMKKDVTSFIQRNKGFLQTDNWRDFSTNNASLAMEVYDAVFRQLKLS